MSIINKLPNSVANQIAAGEVIQRPASIVKELLENSIDAEAKNIKVIIKDAGKQSITIIDDGIGMNLEDARKCFSRHSTSKLKKAEDLFKIKTMGFRGEALASVSAVTEVVLKTKSRCEDFGYELKLKNSEIIEENQVNTKDGTTIITKNLFFNIPARRNFLKSNNIELRHIIDEFIRCALSNNNINFILINEDSEIFNLKKSNLSKRIISIFKKKYEKQLISCNEKFGAISINGFIGKPESAKKTRGEQFIYVNNRFIKNNYLNHSILKSYEGLIEDKKIPFYILFIDINSDQVDVNIHPTKTEVKFEDEKLIYSLINSSVNRSLEKYNISPSLNFDADINFVKKAVVNYDQNINASKTISHLEKKTNWDEIFNKVKIENIDNKLFDINNDDEKDNKPVQFLDIFIFKQLGEKLLVFNHKNCQERILHDKFSKNTLSSYSNSQQNLFPQYIEFNSSDYEIIKNIIPDIRSLGFNIEIFGKNSIVINGIPTGLDDINEKEIIESFLEEIKNNNSDIKAEKKKIIVNTLSKKARITNNKKLTLEEMNSIIDRLFACKNSKYSPSGKQNYIELGIENIENLF